MKKLDLDLDDNLLAKALKLSVCETKEEVIHEALMLYIQLKSTKHIHDIKRKTQLADDITS